MLAGYLVVNTGKKVPLEKHGKADTYAIENLTFEEEAELLRYLKYYRATKFTTMRKSNGNNHGRKSQ